MVLGSKFSLVFVVVVVVVVVFCFVLFSCLYCKCLKKKNLFCTTTGTSP